jgi:hypothetical protein
LDNRKLVKVIDFGTGNYSNDYTGHGFLGTYLYERQQFILNNSYEYSNFFKRPYQSVKSPSSLENNQSPYPSISETQQQPSQQRQNYRPPAYQQPYMQILKNYQDSLAKSNQHLLTDTFDSSYNNNQQNQMSQQQLQYQQTYQQQKPYDGSYLPQYLQRPITSINEFSPFVYLNKNNVPITSWDPIIDNDRNNLNRVPDRNSPIGFDQWYINSIVTNTAYETLKTSIENPFILQTLKYIDTYRYAKVWWNNESAFLQNTQE